MSIFGRKSIDISGGPNSRTLLRPQFEHQKLPDSFSLSMYCKYCFELFFFSRLVPTSSKTGLVSKSGSSLSSVTCLLTWPGSDINAFGAFKASCDWIKITRHFYELYLIDSFHIHFILIHFIHFIELYFFRKFKAQSVESNCRLDRMPKLPPVSVSWWASVLFQLFMPLMVAWWY